LTPSEGNANVGKSLEFDPDSYREEFGVVFTSKI